MCRNLRVPKLIAKQLLVPKWRAYVRTRPIALYWWDQMGRHSYAPEGPGRKRDRAAFEAEAFERAS